MDMISRNQTFRFSCSKSEKEKIDNIIKDSGANKNDFIISTLLNDYKTKTKNAAITACRISDHVNQLEENYPEVDFMPLRKEVDLLCQYLLQ